MSSNPSASPFLARALSSNGDSQSEDDDVFLNSRLDVISRNCDEIDHDSNFHNHSQSTPFLNFIMDQNSVTNSIFTPSPKANENAVIFSVYFCGKYFGEVGLFEPDISILDWVGFKSYIFSSLNLESFDSYGISYFDEGDKVPIECEYDYREALKIAKLRACEEEKTSIYISRIGGGFPNSLRSLVSSSLRRVNSVGGGPKAAAVQPLKKDVTTSTSFNSLDKENSNHSIELNSEGGSPPFLPLTRGEELNSPQDNYFGGDVQLYDKHFYECLNNASGQQDPIPRSFSAYPPENVDSWDAMAAQESSMDISTVPNWFSSYMKQFKEELSQEVSSKIDERFEETVGNLSATDVEVKLRGLLTGYSTELQNKVLCCCKSPNDHCQKGGSEEGQQVVPRELKSQCLDGLSKMEGDRMTTPLINALKLDRREDSLEGECPNNQDYFLQKLLKREQEILDFLDNTNEKIKQKININNDYTDSLRTCLTKELAIEERERVLARIEDFRQRQSRTTNDIKMLQQTMEVNNEGMARLALQNFIPAKDYDAKFIKDESFVDGSKVLPLQCFSKKWAVQNTGLRPWNNETFLVCQSYHHMSPIKQSVPCPQLRPGQIGTISADFKAPSTPGIYSTEWRFIQGDKLFGNHLWCTVIVPSKSGRLIRDGSPYPTDIEASLLPILPNTNAYSSLEDLVREPSSLGNLREMDRASSKVESEASRLEECDVKLEDDLEETFEDSYGFNDKDYLCHLTAKGVLKHVLYVLRLSRPDFSSLKDENHFKLILRYLLRGNDTDSEDVRTQTDRDFIEVCRQKNCQLIDVAKRYDSLFHTKKEEKHFDSYFRTIAAEFLNEKSQELERELTQEDRTLGSRIQDLINDTELASLRGVQDSSYLVPVNENHPSELTSLLDSQEVQDSEKMAEYNRDEDRDGDDELGDEDDDENDNDDDDSDEDDEDYEEEYEVKPLEESGESDEDDEDELVNGDQFEYEDYDDSDEEYGEEEDEYENEGNKQTEDNEMSDSGRFEFEPVRQKANELSDPREGDSRTEVEEETYPLNIENSSTVLETEEQFATSSNAPYSVATSSSRSPPREAPPKNSTNMVSECESDGELNHKGIEESFCKINKEDLEDKAEGVGCPDEGEGSTSYSEYSESDSSLESDRGQGKSRASKSNSRKEKGGSAAGDLLASTSLPSEDEKSSKVDSSRVPKVSNERNFRAGGSDFFQSASCGEIHQLTQVTHPNAFSLSESKRDFSESKGHRESGLQQCSGSFSVNDMKLTSRDMQKNITSLHHNYQQNVEVRLDFEVFSRNPTLKQKEERKPPIGNVDALTFQEKHFTVSSRLPPEPVAVPDSDDESFDGIVIIKDTNIPSSAPPTEPCSPSGNPSNNLLLDDSERSVSCSSFSELDEEDFENDRAEGGNESAYEYELANSVSSHHESESTDVCSETSSSSVIVDEPSSIYYESSLAEDLEQFFTVRSEEEKKEEEANCLKSPDNNVDSGSSTSHTLKDIIASESSESYDVNEAPVVDLAQEESTSEFEYVPHGEN